MRINLLLLLILLVLPNFGCAGWKTRFSSASASMISINLYKDGRIVMGPCGFGRITEEKYDITMSPGKHLYRDSEIVLKKDDQIIPVIGEILFSEDFSHVKMNIKVQKDEVWVIFPGNGKYTVNHDA
jgi:hypothetical protein